jgi:hypothetical protein
MSAPDAYNIDTYTRDLNDDPRRAFPTFPVRVGGSAPTFKLPLIDGGAIDFSELLGRDHLVLVFGCFTAPPSMAQMVPLENLHRTYGGRGFSFLYVYTREVHPGEYYPPHRSMEQKIEQARKMRDRMRITFPVAVDDVEGTVHRAYGDLPSFAIVIHRDGTVIARMQWTQAEQIRLVLENLLLRDRDEAENHRGRLSYVEWISYMSHEPKEYWDLIDEAGPKARAEYELANPPDAPRYRL